MSARVDFPKNVLEVLAKRVGMRCSNPQCRQPTAGPGELATLSVNIGVGAHICAASPGGPRFNATQTPGERSAIENGIWLCQNCAKLIDNDPARFPVELLYRWKRDAEQVALQALKGEAETVSDPAVVKIRIDKKNVRINGDRHDYRLEVRVENCSAQVLRGYHADLVMPTLPLISTVGRVESRSDRSMSLFRKIPSSPADDIYPGDAPVLFDIEYHMTSPLFRERDRLFSLVVQVSFYLDGKRLATGEKLFYDLQMF
jgi:uncharacterized protein YfcZ (UPF0381/DUF406 family)